LRVDNRTQGARLHRKPKGMRVQGEARGLRLEGLKQWREGQGRTWRRAGGSLACEGKGEGVGWWGGVGGGLAPGATSRRKQGTVRHARSHVRGILRHLRQNRRSLRPGGTRSPAPCPAPCTIGGGTSPPHVAHTEPPDTARQVGRLERRRVLAGPLGLEGRAPRRRRPAAALPLALPARAPITNAPRALPRAGPLGEHIRQPGGRVACTWQHSRCGLSWSRGLRGWRDLPATCTVHGRVGEGERQERQAEGRKRGKGRKRVKKGRKRGTKGGKERGQRDGAGAARRLRAPCSEHAHPAAKARAPLRGDTL